MTEAALECIVEQRWINEGTKVRGSMALRGYGTSGNSASVLMT